MGAKQGGQSVLNDISYMIRLPCGFYLKKYCNASKELGLLQNVKIVDQNAPLTNRMKLSGKGAGEIQYRVVFLEAFRLLNLSVPYLGLLIPS